MVLIAYRQLRMLPLFKTITLKMRQLTHRLRIFLFCGKDMFRSQDILNRNLLIR